MTKIHSFIHTQNLSKGWDRPVLKKISLDIPQGQSMVLIGGSGTGKSVLLKCLLGLIIPDSGQVLVDQHDVTYVPTMKRTEHWPKTGVLFQGSALFDSLTVAENIVFPLLQRGMIRRRDAVESVAEKLREVGLSPDNATLRPSQLSGGMQRRVALARAIVEHPTLMFFDEPTAGLDPVMSTVISHLIRSSIDKMGATALTITHDLKNARIIGDSIAMLHDGGIIWQGSVQDLDHVSDTRVSAFIHGDLPADGVS